MKLKDVDRRTLRFRNCEMHGRDVLYIVGKILFAFDPLELRSTKANATINATVFLKKTASFVRSTQRVDLCSR